MRSSQGFILLFESLIEGYHQWLRCSHKSDPQKVCLSLKSLNITSATSQGVDMDTSIHSVWSWQNAWCGINRRIASCRVLEREFPCLVPWLQPFHRMRSRRTPSTPSRSRLFSRIQYVFITSKSMYNIICRMR